MQDFSHININFNDSQVTLLNLCLGILMFGVSLDLKAQDFLYLVKAPRIIFIGVFSQWILLPIITLALIYILQPAYPLALGMILIAACPGGNVSNYAVHLANANVALSIILTIISTLFCAFTTPFIFTTLQQFLPSGLVQNTPLTIHFTDMMMTILQLIILPMCLGILSSKYFPNLVLKVKGWVKKLSFLIFIGFVVAAVAGNINNLGKYLHIVFFIVLIHNGLALFIGYVWPRYIMRLAPSESRTISIETGIQNSGLALILIFNFFDGNGGMALIAAWWSIWHLLSSLTLAVWWKSKPSPSSVHIT